MYTTQQLLINVLDLFTQTGLYQRKLKDWECKPEGEQTWINLRPHIQEAYQQRLTLGTVTSAQGGYAQNNQLAGLTRNEESTNNTADTIADTITTHMAKLSKMRTASINKHTTQTNASLQQLAANTNQLHQQQEDIINQMGMMTMNHGASAPATQQTFARAHPPIYQPPALPQYQLGYNMAPQQFGGCGTTAMEVDMVMVAAAPDVEEDVATQGYQCHTLEAINWYHTHWEARNNNQRQTH